MAKFNGITPAVLHFAPLIFFSATAKNYKMRTSATRNTAKRRAFRLS